MVSKQKLKHYLWSALGVIGVVFFWAGLWDGIGNLYYLVNPLVSLGTGVFILLATELIFNRFGLLKKSEKTIEDLISKVHSHPKKHEFHIQYHDKSKKRHVTLPANKLKDIEKSYLVLAEGQKEIFVPIHRVTKVLHKGKSWRGKDVKKK